MSSFDLKNNVEILKKMFIIIFVSVVIVFCVLMLFEVNYFLRTFFTYVFAHLKGPVSILDETVIKGVCTTADIDPYLTHMNNTRIIRELDFARVDFFQRSGLFKILRKYGTAFRIGATTVRYRKAIKLFSFFRLTTKIIYWDEKALYMEHRFLSKGNFICAIVLSTIRFKNGVNVETLVDELLMIPENCDTAAFKKPELNPVLEHWIKSNELSSQMLKKSADIAEV